VSESNTRMNELMRQAANRRRIGALPPADDTADPADPLPGIDAGPGRPVPPPPKSVNQIIRDAALAQRRPNP